MLQMLLGRVKKHQRDEEYFPTPKKKKEESAKALKRKTIGDAAILHRLQKNADFKWFLENIVGPSMENLKEGVFSGDLGTEEARQDTLANVVAYKRTQNIFSTIFSVFDAEAKRVAKLDK